MLDLGLDPDLHSEKLLDPDPHSEKLLDPDPHKINADLPPWSEITFSTCVVCNVVSIILVPANISFHRNSNISLPVTVKKNYVLRSQSQVTTPAPAQYPGSGTIVEEMKRLQNSHDHLTCAQTWSRQSLWWDPQEAYGPQERLPQRGGAVGEEEGVERPSEPRGGLGAGVAWRE